MSQLDMRHVHVGQPRRVPVRVYTRRDWRARLRGVVYHQLTVCLVLTAFAVAGVIGLLAVGR